MYQWYVGIDWASTEHQVCLVPGDGEASQQWKVAHSASGLAQLHQRLAELAPPSAIAVGIEVPHGAVVEGLLLAGFAVYALNPIQLDRFRDRHCPSGAKDDRRDAYVLADALKRDMPRFSLVKPRNREGVQLRELSHWHEHLKEELQRHCNQLWGYLNGVLPQLLHICSGANKPWLWALLQQHELTQLEHLDEAYLESWLVSQRIRRLKAPQVQKALALLPLAPGHLEALALILPPLLEQIHSLAQQRKVAFKQIQQLLKEQGTSTTDKPSDVAIMASFPGLGPWVMATLLAEGGEWLEQRNYSALRKQAGVAPVTKRSGKSFQVLMRRACSRRLRDALYHWARIHMQREEAGRQRYQQLRQRGKTHGRALRTLADGLLRQLIAMLTKGELYRPLTS